MGRDVYVNLDPLRGAPRIHESKHEVQRGLVFIEASGLDLIPGAWLERFHDLRRRVARRLLVDAHLFVFRGAPREAAHAVCQSLELTGACVVLTHPIGADPTIEGELPTGLDMDVPARARAIELEAFLDWNRAVWEPTKYHFLLPSGAHAAAFVKAGQAIAIPRDAESVSNWLVAHLVPGTGIVSDTGTLTPLLLASLRKANASQHPVRVIDGYPKTYLDVATAIEAVALNAARVVVLLSVNSTGQLLSHAIAHLQEITLREIDVRVVILIDQAENRSWNSVGSVLVERWLPLPDRDRVAEPQTTQEKCLLCRDAERAMLVPIDPASFDQQLPSFHHQVMPDVVDARENRRFWELCCRSAAIGVTDEADTHVIERRPEGKMAIKVRHERLLDSTVLDSTELAEAARARIARAIDAGRYWKTAGAFGLVLVPERDLNLPGFRTFFAKTLGPVVPTPFPSHIQASDLPHELADEIQRAARVTVFTLGTVTGTILQLILSVVQSIRRGDPKEFELDGIVVHARPNNKRLWDTLVNSYAKHLLPLWLTYLPDWSPLEEERSFLERVDATLLDEGSRAFLTRRFQFIKGAAPRDPLFWGTPSDGILSPHSIFGEALDARTTYAAVSSALMKRRAEETSAPERLAFEIGPIVRSYYDPLILASMFRWLRASECWWGRADESAAPIVGDILTRAEQSDIRAHRLLVAELLLAAAQGKIPKKGIQMLLAAAAALETDPLAGPAIRLGLALLERVTPKNESARGIA